MSIYDDALPELQPGYAQEIVRAGHVFHVIATRNVGWNTGRRRYSVECLTCRAVVHEATTGPMEMIERHLRSFSRGESR